MHWLLLAALSASPHVASPSLSIGGGPSSTYSGLIDWSAGNYRASYGPGIPAPTIDCVAAAAGGEMTCVGATATKAGNPTTGTSPWWRPLAVATEPSVVLGGSADYYNMGDIGDPWTDYAICVEFATNNVAANKRIVTKGGNGGDAIILRVQSSGALGFYSFNGVGGNSALNSASTLTAGAYNVACVSFDYVANGTSIMRMNLNGDAPTPITNAVGPTPDLSETLKIGAAAAAIAEYFAGNITRVSIWTQAFTAAELATMVRSQRALLASKPAASELTWTSDATFCQPFSDATLYRLAANVPCVTSGASGGVGVFGAIGHSNLALQSSTIATGTNPTSPWTKTDATAGIVVLDDDACVDPAGSTTMDSLTTTGATMTNGVYQNVSVASTTGPATAFAWVRSLSGTQSESVGFCCGGGGSLPVSVTCRSSSGTCTAITVANCAFAHASVGTTPVRLEVTAGCDVTKTVYNLLVHDGIYGTSNNVGGCFSDVKLIQASYGGPAVATTAAPVSGNADSASVAAQLANAAKWALGIKATPSGGWDRAGTIGLLQWGGTYGAANSVSLYVDTSHKLILEVYDNAGTPAWKRWTSTDALSGTTAKSIIATNSGGTWTLYVDGAAVAGALSGTGTGVQTAVPTTATVNIGTVGSSVLNGYALKVCQAKDFAGCRKGLQ